MNYPKLKIMTTSLCFLTLNELNGCKNDIPSIDLSNFDDVYAIDGNSTDGTIKFLESQNIKVIRQKQKGYNAAYIEAFQYCKTDYLIIFHPKGSIDPKYIYDFHEFFKKGYDLVIASRMIKDAKNEEDSKILRPRKSFVLFLSFIATIIWKKEGNAIKDVLHGFRGMKVDSFFKLNLLKSGITADIEMVVKGYKNKFKIIEFPIQESERISGSTHFKAFPTGKKILKYLFNELLNKN